MFRHLVVEIHFFYFYWYNSSTFRVKTTCSLLRTANLPGGTERELSERLVMVTGHGIATRTFGKKVGHSNMAVQVGLWISFVLFLVNNDMDWCHFYGRFVGWVCACGQRDCLIWNTKDDLLTYHDQNSRLNLNHVLVRWVNTFSETVFKISMLMWEDPVLYFRVLLAAHFGTLRYLLMCVCN